LGIKEVHIGFKNPQIFIIIFWGLQQGLMRDLLLLFVENRRWLVIQPPLFNLLLLYLVDRATLFLCRFLMSNCIPSCCCLSGTLGPRGIC
jgi:hypothetical protein